MSKGDPTKWSYFEEMDILPFLTLCLFYHDKQIDIRRQQEMNKK